MITSKNQADPRVKRTRQLLQDAFTSLVQEKDFESITVKDIAEKATVNRATFYAHFTDKFEILESKITESFMAIVDRRLSGHTRFSEETMQHLFLAVCDFHQDLSTLCRRSYRSLGSIFEIQIKEKIQMLILSLMTNNRMPTKAIEPFIMNTASVMLSWGMYGAAYNWNSEGRQISAESLVAESMPLVMNGFKQLMEQV